MLEVTIDI